MDSGLKIGLPALLGVILAVSVFADPQPPEPSTGPALAEAIRNAAPEDTNTVQGTLIITVNHQSRRVPVVCRVTIHDGSWQTEYGTAATTNSGSERLIVIHRPDAPNEYLFARAPDPSAPAPKLEPLSPKEAAVTPLAGSDFSAGDLGMDFLHWPQQIKLKGEMRLGQPCYVLESLNPAAKVIVRVKSYIDKETDAPIVAEGYDAAGHEVKEFSLHGSSFRKVNGHWRLENMEIRDKKKHSRTELKFDILDK